MVPITSTRSVARLLPALAMTATGAAAQAPGTTPVRLSPDQIVARVARCGLPVARVSIRGDRELQEDVIAIATGPSLDDAQLACIARASLAATTYVEFNEPDQQTRYDRVYRPIENAEAAAGARAWLNARGLLANLPSFDPKRQSLAAYARDLESLCGVPRGGFFTATGPMLTIRRDLLTPPSTAKPFGGAITDDQFECLLAGVAASNLGEHGAGFGFIGNAASGN